jgi:putative oxidoreductase
MPTRNLLGWQSWDLGALAIRIPLGLIMLLHGAQKVFGAFGGAGPAGFTESIGMMGFQPAPLWAGLAMLAELGGGLLVILGVATEVGAFLFAINMLVAIWRVHWANGFFNQAGGVEFPLILLAAAVALILGGRGRYAVWNPFRRE